MSRSSATQSAAKLSAAESASEGVSDLGSARNMWQHPFVDVFKQFKIMPNQDWKLNKKQGDVSEQFAKEIGRKVIVLSGKVSANNFVQIPSPTCAIKSLQLTGRYMYLQLKAPTGSEPFTFHIDLQLVERSHGIRISCSNLYKTLQTQNGFVCQLPLNVPIDQWTVACIDIHEALRQSGLLQSHTMLSYQIKQIMLCANSMVRGVFTSDNLYSFQSLPPELKFKYTFPTGKWLEYFSWIDLPQDIGRRTEESERKPANIQIPHQAEPVDLTQEQKENLQREVQNVLDARRKAHEKPESKLESLKMNNQKNFAQLQESLEQLREEQDGVSANEKFVRQSSAATAKSANVDKMALVTGQYINDHRRSEKLNLDPILELKHIIGFSPVKCPYIKWSRVPGETTIVYASEGALIAMDIESGEQRRFFFGHNQPICCFDIAPHGGMIASAQEGQFSIVRIWDYYTARCISMLTLPCSSLVSLAFSPDGQYLATVGKSSAKVGKTVQYNKELLIIWDLSKIHKGEKPEIAAKHTLEYNILALKFSPIDNSRLVSCGKENIRFWRVKDQGTIRGSAVVLNQHARNTVFTCLDFEWGCTATGPYCPKGANNERGIMNHVSPENEALKRVYVGSRHGMVFQINYKTEQLEATYRTNETAIQSIAVNEAFCVTGSDDQFLRVWPLDFSEFFMEAKHEGSVMNVQISPDGLKVVCGTRNGSIGVLDKSNQKYRTLLRAHTAAVLGFDFHVPRKAIVTVSADATIRLWDNQFFDQSVEFSSPIDQPISVAAHPTLPIFSCGFQSGSMRIFDIEKTCLADEFTQFNKALKKLRYSPCGSLLVAVCEDGSVSLHDCRRQHLPSKMMHLEQAPEFVHVAFTPLIRKSANRATLFANPSSSSLEGGNVQVQESMFGVMGEYGNMCMIYDTDSVILKHSVQAGHQLRAFEFTKDGRQLVCLLSDQRIRFYSLESFGGILVRELPNTHRTSINSADLSLNGGFMMTGGEDSLIKVWDSEAPKSVPYFYQAFIGHTYGVQNVQINPAEQGQVCSTAGEDGIFIWQFSGDTTTNFFPDHPQISNEAPNEEAQPGHLTMLEKMRAQVKDKQGLKLDEYCFILPNFQNIAKVEESEDVVAPVLSESREFYDNCREENHLTYNHFTSCQNKKEFEVELELKTMLVDQTSEKVIEPCIVNGFDGFSGAHSNLIWNWQQNQVIYTLNNKVVVEDMKTRGQVVLANSQVRLSCLAQAVEGRIIVAGEGETNPQKVSLIFVYNNQKLASKLTFHQKGVQSLQFVRRNTLVSLGVQAENILVVWDLDQGLVLQSVRVQSHSTNAILVNNYLKDMETADHVHFCTVGSKGHFCFWQYTFEENDLGYSEVESNLDLMATDFVCGTFAPVVQDQQMVLIGCSDGSLVSYDVNKIEWCDKGMKNQLLKSGQIGAVSIKNQIVVLITNEGQIIKYPINGPRVLPPADTKLIQCIQHECGVTSLCMDDLQQEGIVGTTQGNLLYVNFSERQTVKVVSRASESLDCISEVIFDPSNPAVFLTSAGEHSNEVKVFATSTMDQITTFRHHSASPVRFIAAFSATKHQKQRLRMIGHADGELKFVTLESLKVEFAYKVDLNEGEQLTKGCFSQSGHNFAVGTSQGNVYFGHFKKDQKTKTTVVKIAKLKGLSLSEAHAVTSIEMTAFTPDGMLLAAFDNGEVRVWRSFYSDGDADKPKRKNLGKKPVDIADLGNMQFDIVDNFNMFQNPHGLDNLTEEDQKQLSELYSGKCYKDCRAAFCPAQSDFFLCSVSALQYLFVRNFSKQETVKRIALMYFPTSISVADYAIVAQENDLGRVRTDGQVMAAVGTQEGRVLVYRLDLLECSARVMSRTQAGLIYGQVATCSLSENGQVMIATSNSGELMSFDLRDCVKTASDE